MSKILIVEDTDELMEALRAYFEMKGFTVDVCTSGEDALQMLAAFGYDIIVMDWGLPSMSGIEVCRQFRKNGGQTPLIFLTGRDGIADLEEGLDCGADDYVCKPFAMRELFARVKTLLKRRTGTFVPDLQIGDLLLQQEKNMLVKGSQEVQLRAKESALLEYLMRHPNQLFSAQQLLDAIWSADGEGSTDSVRSWINLLRHKLAQVGEEGLIKTVIGSGYMIEVKD